MTLPALIGAILVAGFIQLYAVVGPTEGSQKYLVIGVAAITMILLLGAMAWLLRADAV